jgi:flagellar protein FliS
MTAAMTKGYGAYGSSRYGAGKYQTAASQPRVFQNIRLLDEILGHLQTATRADRAGKQGDEYAAVEAAVLILRGLNAMLDKRQGRVAENLGKTYRSLIVALHGVCSMINTQGQYARLYQSVLDLRNAWASITGIGAASAAPDMDATLMQQPAKDLLGLSESGDTSF